MSKQRSSIKLLPHERPLLVDAYVRRRIPIDQYESRPEELASLAREFNRLTSRKDSPEDLLHYMRTQRKRGLWVRFDGQHEAVPPPAELSAEESEILVRLYREHVAELSYGSDILGYDPEIANLLAKEFAAEIGRIIPPHQLIARLTALRKRGHLPPAAEEPKQRDDDIGFSDIDQFG